MPSRFAMVRAAVRERPSLGSLAIVYGLFKLVEEGAWIAMTILAHARGGVGEASVVIAIQLVPATLVAVSVGGVLRRRGGRSVLVAGLVAVAVAQAGLGTLIAVDASSAAIYTMAAVSASVVATIRPAVSSLLPWLVRDPQALTTATVLLGWVAGVATLGGPALVAVLLGFTNASVPFVVFAVVALAASVVARRLPSGSVRAEVARAPLRRTIARVARSRGPRNAIIVLTVYSFVIGTMDVAVVLIAGDVLGADSQVAGWFGTAVGAGTLCGTLGAVLMVGRRWLWPWALGAGALTSVGLGLLAGAGIVPVAAAAFLAVGVGMAALGVAGKALLQRLSPSALVGDAFGVQEGIASLATLAGAAAIPVFVGLLGSGLAVVGVLVTVVVGMALATPGLARAEREEEDGSWKVRALGETPIFASLPVGALEGLAAAARPVDFAPGDVLMTQGDRGDLFHVITQGRVEIDQHGTIVAHCGVGEGVGELALLNDAPRNATVRAVEPVATLAVDSGPFLAAIA